MSGRPHVVHTVCVYVCVPVSNLALCEVQGVVSTDCFDSDDGFVE